MEVGGGGGEGDHSQLSVSPFTGTEIATRSE